MTAAAPSRIILTKEYRFEASHRLPEHDGKCQRLHGHSWRAKISFCGIVPGIQQQGPKKGMLVDYGDIDQVCKSITQSLDHTDLNEKFTGDPEVGSFPPTSEIVALWIGRQIEHALRFTVMSPHPVTSAEEHGIYLHSVEIDETCTSSCIVHYDHPHRRLTDDGKADIKTPKVPESVEVRDNADPCYNRRNVFEIFQDLINAAYGTAKEKGWWDTPIRSFGEQIALIHSELSEALEEYRRHGLELSKFLYHRQDDTGPVKKPEGIAAEFADVFIRMFDTCGAYEIPIAEALIQKLEYNQTRPHRHGNKKL